MMVVDSCLLYGVFGERCLLFVGCLFVVFVVCCLFCVVCCVLCVLSVVACCLLFVEI